MNKILISAFIVVLCVLPVASYALSTDEIQARIQSLLAQITSLTAQIQSLQGSASTPRATTPPAYGLKHRVCALALRNLAQGSEGDDVRSLQEFLNSEGLLMAGPTGYFGPLTAQALAKWQEREGVSAVGVFGPLSRARIQAFCGSVSNQERFSATPERGAAPLTVTFENWLSGFRTPNVSYMIDFGDGTSERATDCSAPADACVSSGKNVHTYSSDGTYVATLNKITDPCPDDGDPQTPRCLAAVQNEVVARTQIVVGSIACTKEYRPVCASKQVVCVTTPCNPIQQTYSNRCMAGADGATVLYDGTCRNTTSDPSTDPRCRSWFDGCNTCARSEPNGPAMCTLKACSPESMQKPYCTGYFGDSSSAPTISGFSGPTSLRINETGTWTVQASDPDGEQLSYYVSWGDERHYASGISTSLPVFTQTSSFTHTYSTAGTYVVTVVARDVDGKEAKVSITVTVGGVAACTTEYRPVCGRPSGCANTCAPGMYCTLECRLHDPKTYSNRCSLDAAGAEYLYEGVCEK